MKTKIFDSVRVFASRPTRTGRLRKPGKRHTKRGASAFAGLLLAVCLYGCAGKPGTPPERMPVLFDTDLGNDIDDVLALQMLLNYDRAGIIDLAGISISKANPYAVEYIDGYCRLNGKNGIPLGYAYRGVMPDDGSYLRRTLDTVVNGRKPLLPVRNIRDSLPEGYKLLRRLLASYPDGSVTVIAVGPQTNLAALLRSVADEYSPLDGRALVAKKVKLLSVMGGLFGHAFDFPEWNVVQDAEAARTVFEAWPTPVVASGWEVGNRLLYPHESILRDFPEEHPLAVSYKLYGAMPYDRQTWDLTSVLEAVEPDHGYFNRSPAGIIRIDSAGYSVFTPLAGGRHRYLLLPEENADKTLAALVSRVTGKGKAFPLRNPEPGEEAASLF